MREHHLGAPLTHIEVLALRAVGQNTGDIVRHPFQVPPAGPGPRDHPWQIRTGWDARKTPSAQTFELIPGQILQT